MGSIDHNDEWKKFEAWGRVKEQEQEPIHAHNWIVDEVGVWRCTVCGKKQYN
jgi:hypothetical protein